MESGKAAKRKQSLLQWRYVCCSLINSILVAFLTAAIVLFVVAAKAGRIWWMGGGRGGNATAEELKSEKDLHLSCRLILIHLCLSRSFLFPCCRRERLGPAPGRDRLFGRIRSALGFAMRQARQLPGDHPLCSNL